MSRMSELVIDIQEDLEKGILSFAEIAAKHEVPASWVSEVAVEYATQGSEEPTWDYTMENDYMDDY